MLPNNQWITLKKKSKKKSENAEEIKKYLGTNENKNTTIQNLQDTAKALDF